MRIRRRQREEERDRRRSVYENRSAPEPEEDWRPIGEFDPATGRSTIDLDKARRWRPLSEFWRR